MNENKLNTKQLQAIDLILCNSSIEKVAKKLGISRQTIHNWLREKPFKEHLEKERKELFEEGLNALKGAMAKASRALIGLLDCDDRKERRLAAKEIINMALKVCEIKELEERISGLEDFLDKRERDKFKN